MKQTKIARFELMRTKAKGDKSFGKGKRLLYEPFYFSPLSPGKS